MKHLHSLGGIRKTESNFIQNAVGHVLDSAVEAVHTVTGNHKGWGIQKKNDIVLPESYNMFIDYP